MAYARTVRYESWVTQLIDDYSVTHPRIWEIKDALEWRISRDPQSGYPIPGVSPPRYLVRSDEWNIDGLSILTLAYDYSDDLVTVEFARINE